MSEYPISISNLNDFIFCPVLIYFHSIDTDTEKLLYQDEAQISSYGFDTYCGVMHTQFYMRKSLVCDIVEPFRPIIDEAVKKGINLKQIKQEDFTLIKGQYQLQWKNNSAYIKLLMKSIMEYKDEIFVYIRDYYRAFMKGASADDFPIFDLEE